MSSEPDWKELYTDARTTIIMRDAEIYTLRNSMDVVREREPVTATLAFAAGCCVGALIMWLVLV